MPKIVSAWHEPESCKVHYLLPGKREVVVDPENLPGGSNVLPHVYIFKEDLDKVRETVKQYNAVIKYETRKVFPLPGLRLLAKISCPTPEKVGDLTRKLESMGVSVLDSHIPYARRLALDKWMDLDRMFNSSRKHAARAYVDTEVDERDGKTVIAFSVVGEDSSGTFETAVGGDCIDLVKKTLKEYDVIIGWNIEYDRKKIESLLLKEDGGGSLELVHRTSFYDLMKPYIIFRRLKPPAPSTWKLKDVYMHEFGETLPTAYDVGEHYWSLFEKDRKRLMEINMMHARALYLLDKKYTFSHVDEMVAEEACITLDKVYEKTLVWSSILRKQGIVVPGRSLFSMKEVQGAMIFDPEPGLIENVYVFDIVSLYPTILKNAGVTGLSDAVKLLLERRIALKKAMKEAASKGDTVTYQSLNAQQTALKVIINSAVGVMGRYGDGKNGLYYPDGISKVTEKGRRVLLKLKESLDARGYGRAVYGDTDSIFVKLSGDCRSSFDEAKNVILPHLNSVIKAELGEDSEIELDKVFEKIVFVTKKKYAAKAVYVDGSWLPKPKTVMVGLETVRGDWCQLSKQVLEEAIEMVFAGKSVEEIVSKVNGYFFKMLDGEFDEKLVLYRSLSRPVKSYKNKNIPHLRALEKLKEKGYRVNVGDKISYVIVSAENRIEVEPVTEDSFPNIQVSGYEYYWRRQIIPPVERLLSAAFNHPVEVGKVGVMDRYA